MMLYWLQQTGNKPIVLMGGGTTRVGDPSGKDETRAIRPDRGDRAQQGEHQAASLPRCSTFGTARAMPSCSTTPSG